MREVNRGKRQGIGEGFGVTFFRGTSIKAMTSPGFPRQIKDITSYPAGGSASKPRRNP